MSKTVGVLGGMGPEATAHFFHQLIRWTPAENDQGHLKILIVNDPGIPDRTRYLLGQGESPLPRLLQSAQDLQRIGADFIAIPCNTAHFFWEEITQHVQIPVLNIILETSQHVAGSTQGAGEGKGVPIGLLATEGTIQSQLYHQGLKTVGLTPVVPDSLAQKQICESVHLIKARSDMQKAARLIAGVIRHLEEEYGVRGVILGCTELGLVKAESRVPVHDSLSILAQRTVQFALGTEEQSGKHSPLHGVGERTKC